uniref:Uncharacterized protein n=1 Tax=Panagrolaimus superbus TaxID=310955 RepID=A0A914YQL0_9BILA
MGTTALSLKFASPVPVNGLQAIVYSEFDSILMFDAGQRYNIMKNRTHDTGETKDLKKEIAATLKNQETQELIQRKNEYKEVHEEIPKTLDKKIPQVAVTLDQKSEKKKKTQAEKPKKPKKFVVKKT